MEAIVLTGGLGTRLRDVVPNLPKPMAPVAGRPFLEILLAKLSHNGFLRVVLSVGYLAETIMAHFGDQFSGMNLVYAREESPLGTGGAIRFGFTFCKNDHAFIFNGDTYLDVEVKRLEAHWQSHHRPIIVARAVADTARFGRLEFRDGNVRGFSSTPHSGPGLINAGCYVLPIDALDAYAVGHGFSFEDDYLPVASRSGLFDGFVTRGNFIDIGAPEDYVRAQGELAKLAL